MSAAGTVPMDADAAPRTSSGRSDVRPAAAHRAGYRSITGSSSSSSSTLDPGESPAARLGNRRRATRPGMQDRPAA